MNDLNHVIKNDRVASGCVLADKFLLRLIFAAFFLLLFFFVSHEEIIDTQQQNINDKVLGVETQNIKPSIPVRLIIPNIKVYATVETVGVASDGTMGVPLNTSDVAWFNLGTKPGEWGSAVIAGHFNGNYGENAVFSNLYKLKIGDKLYIENDKGVTITFIVQGSRMYNPGFAEEVFSSDDSAHLNLVTCDGSWDGIKKNYSKRLVVFADIAN